MKKFLAMVFILVLIEVGCDFLTRTPYCNNPYSDYLPVGSKIVKSDDNGWVTFEYEGKKYIGCFVGKSSCVTRIED